jgi:hypothetical protein
LDPTLAPAGHIVTHAYGAGNEPYEIWEGLDGSTPCKNFVLASDSIFPSIGIPAVAIVGASAANSMVSVFQHLATLQRLELDGKLLM